MTFGNGLSGAFEAARLFGLATDKDKKSLSTWWENLNQSGSPQAKQFLLTNPAAVAARVARGRAPVPYDHIVERPIEQNRISTFGQPVRIAIATPCYFIGGVERWIATLARNLDQDRFAIIKVIVTAPGSIDRRAIHWLPRWTEVEECVTGVIEPDGIDLLITWGQSDLVKVSGKVAAAGVSTINVQHGVYVTKEWVGKLLGQAIEAHDKLGTHLAAVNELCRINFPVELRDKITVIPNGVDQADVEPRGDRESTLDLAGIPPSSKVVLFCGRVSPEKNVQCLVDAIEYLPPEWRLLIVGPDRRAISGVSERCHVIPAQTHVGKWLAAADVVCQPSQFESHCLAINEAWLAGVPVVSTDHPVNRAFVARHGQIMRLVELRERVAGPDPRRLGRAIVEAGQDGRGSDAVKTAKRVAERWYSARTMVAAWERLFAELIVTAGRADNGPILEHSSTKAAMTPTIFKAEYQDQAKRPQNKP